MATKRKKKTLPKNFGELVEKGDIAALKAVFDECELDATGGYSKKTALSFFKIPDELTTWLVEKGAKLDAMDTYGETPLHAQAQSYAANLKVLIGLGADVNANTSSMGTPLHVAASAPHPHNVKALLDAGAKVDLANRDGLTALELTLQRASNSGLARLGPVAKQLLDAGAKTTPKMQAAVKRLGETFEFHRASFNKDTLAETETGLRQLYSLFDVPPVPQRVMHDGKSPVSVKGKTVSDQHQELWALLVPGKGAAKTVQGEVIRIAGRVHDEFFRNGGGNWDAAYKQMCDAFLAHVGDASLAPLIKRVKSGKPSDEDLEALISISVKWVLANPTPVPLGKVAYYR